MSELWLPTISTSQTAALDVPNDGFDAPNAYSDAQDDDLYGFQVPDDDFHIRNDQF
jgi:hypothetical protein